MSLSAGDDVVARRTLGMLDPIEAGSPGVVQKVHWGGYTVDFEGRILHSVSDRDLEADNVVGPWGSSDQAWWLAPSSSHKETPADAKATSTGGAGLGAQDVVLRLLLAVPLVAVLIYALTHLG